MALTKEDLQALEQLFDKAMDNKLNPIREQQEVHNRSITNMEQNVMRELKLLNENLPKPWPALKSWKECAPRWRNTTTAYML